MTAPEVLARPATEDELPRGAKQFIKKAEAAGWFFRATYARGTDPSKKAPTVVDSVMVKIAKHPFRAVAVWHDGSFEMGYAWAGVLPPKARGYRQLTHLLEVS